MRKNASLAVLAGTISAIAGAAPSGRADAMTLAMPAGVLNAEATIEQPAQVRWCGWRGCGLGSPTCSPCWKALKPSATF
jgi:hypothetical protein